METIIEEPGLTKIQFEKRAAMQEAFERIETIAEETGDQGMVESSKKFLSEVSGMDYRLEQSAAKLVEYFEMKAELGRREKELVNIFPEAQTKLSANDSYFLQNQDKKYLLQA